MSAIARPVFRQLPKALKPLNATRTFAISARVMAEGDAGAPRSGGAAASDAFTKREGAYEADYIRKQELEKLEKLKAKAREAQAEVEKHQQEIDKKSK